MDGDQLQEGRMSANPYNPEGRPPPKSDLPNPASDVSKRYSGVTIPHGSKDQEIENLKRLLASVSQRLDALKSRA
jgi:hypothetical protein